jgi:hypothetical protein
MSERMGQYSASPSDRSPAAARTRPDLPTSWHRWSLLLPPVASQRVGLPAGSSVPYPVPGANCRTAGHSWILQLAAPARLGQASRLAPATGRTSASRTRPRSPYARPRPVPMLAAATPWWPWCPTKAPANCLLIASRLNGLSRTDPGEYPHAGPANRHASRAHRLHQ